MKNKLLLIQKNLNNTNTNWEIRLVDNLQYDVFPPMVLINYLVVVR